MASVTSSWWSAHEPKDWSGTGIGACLRVYERNNQKLLEAGAGDKPKNDEQKRLGKESREQLQDILRRLAKWTKDKPLGGTEAADIAAFDAQVRIALDQLKGYA
jgi:hypothetical protein